MFIRYVQTPLGQLALGASEKGLVSSSYIVQAGPETSSPLLEDAAQQVQEWFTGKRKDFDLPLDLAGTQFQLAVWEQLRAIPWGQYLTYGDIARNLGKSGASRAVGNACGANPLLLIIPCHRVLARDGRLGGFSGGLDVKKKLLALEGTEWK